MTQLHQVGKIKPICYHIHRGRQPFSPMVNGLVNRHWLTDCCKPNHAAIQHCLRSSTVSSSNYTLSCTTPQTLQSTGFQSGLFGGRVQDLWTAVFHEPEKLRCHEHDVQVRCPAETQTYLSDATDHWQQSCQQNVYHCHHNLKARSTNTRPEQPSFETATDRPTIFFAQIRHGLRSEFVGSVLLLCK